MFSSKKKTFLKNKIKKACKSEHSFVQYKYTNKRSEVLTKGKLFRRKTKPPATAFRCLVISRCWGVCFAATGKIMNAVNWLSLLCHGFWQYVKQVFHAKHVSGVWREDGFSIQGVPIWESGSASILPFCPVIYPQDHSGCVEAVSWFTPRNIDNYAPGGGWVQPTAR